jgi:dihydroorotase
MVRPSPTGGPGRRPGEFRAEEVLVGRGFWRGRLQPIEVGIGPDGEIIAVAHSVPGRPRHDVGERIILPAATDLHVHFRDPGGPLELESFDSGTRQAALGGVGLVGDMPNTVPLVDDAERLDAKRARANGRLAVDLFLYATVKGVRGVSRLAASAGAFKLYLSPTTGLDEPLDGEDLAGVLAAMADTGLAVTVHAEREADFSHDPGLKPADTAEWDRARPLRSEIRAIEEVLAAGPPALRLHFAHVTSAASAARARDARVSAEATPHHLLLRARSGGGSREKVNPPLRSEAEREALWKAFCAGAVPILASDHAPHLVESKELPFERAPSGMPGVETMLPLLLEEVRRGELGLETLLKAACDRPARWIGAPMGRLAPGHWANLLVVDFRERRKVQGRRLHGPCGWSAFEGWEAVFPLEHYRRGTPIVRGGEFVGDHRAQVVRPEYAPGAQGTASVDRPPRP